ncbi:MAG: hypothetical protein EZS28_033853 [Streblomastix strix]|uniref:Uncharacterized protein n=1 Tax=Streblomastix strix TaxID=222440 RepID=A0A5J4UKN6_9EUKA|nr:MAG: hypothetical protein EZS28_033853 [Streblomastix strix]
MIFIVALFQIISSLNFPGSWDSLLIHHQKFEVDSKGDILIDGSSDETRYDNVNITDIHLLNSEISETSNSFRLIPANVINTLKASSRQNFNYERCLVLNNSIKFADLALYGYYAYVRQGANITASLVYNLESNPKNVYGKLNDGNIIRVYGRDDGCEQDNYMYTFGFEINGVVPSNCISNNAILPGHEDAPEGTNMPQTPTKCQNTEIPFTRYLQGFKYGGINKVNNEQMKLYLTRTGPVLTGSTSNQNINIIIGWETGQKGGEQWIVANQKILSVGSGNERYFDIYYEEEKIPFITDEYPNDVLYNGSVLYCDGSCPDPVTEDSDKDKEQEQEQEQVVDCLKTPDDPDCTDESADKADQDGTGLISAVLRIMIVALVLPAIVLFV